MKCIPSHDMSQYILYMREIINNGPKLAPAGPPKLGCNAPVKEALSL